VDSVGVKFANLLSSESWLMISLEGAVTSRHHSGAIKFPVQTVPVRTRGGECFLIVGVVTSAFQHGSLAILSFRRAHCINVTLRNPESAVQGRAEKGEGEGEVGGGGARARYGKVPGQFYRDEFSS
jgi:hypothetical protein